MRIATLAIVLLSAVAAVGEAKNCINPSLVEADGRITKSQFEGSFNGHNPTYWYVFYGQPMHSYSIEFVPTIDNENTNNSISFVNPMVWGPYDISALQANGCFGPSSVSLTATQNFSPAIARSKYGAGQRFSFIQSVGGPNIVSITNSQAAGAYSYRVVDTTMFSARWSTWSGYETTWGMTNMSDMTICGTLYVFNSSGQLLAAGAVVLSPTKQVVHSSSASDLNLPRNSSGYAIFVHLGPPTSVIADSYMVNGAGTVITYTKFENRYPQ